MNKSSREITILVVLLSIFLYLLHNPFKFSDLLNTYCGRFIIVVVLLFITKTNVLLGFFSVFLLILLSKSKIISNIVTFKPLPYEQVQPFYKTMFTFDWKNVEGFRPAPVIGKSGRTVGALRSESQSKEYSQKSDNEAVIQNEYGDATVLNPYQEKYFAEDRTQIQNEEDQIFIDNLLNIQNTMTPKDSSTMVVSPSLFMPVKNDLHSVFLENT
jgi:hypothetical protein